MAFTWHTVVTIPATGTQYRCGHEHPDSKSALPCTRRCYAACKRLGLLDPTGKVSSFNTTLPVLEGVGEMSPRGSMDGKYSGPRTLVSKYNGKCVYCGGAFATGDTIVWSKTTGALHPACHEQVKSERPEPPAPQPVKDPTPMRDVEDPDNAFEDHMPKPAPAPMPSSKPAPMPNGPVDPATLMRLAIEALGIKGAPGESPTIDTAAIIAECTKAVLAKVEARVTVEVKHPDGRKVELEGVQHAEMPRLMRYLANGCNRIWITGEAGLGKTTAVEHAAKALEYPLFVSGAVADKFELLGYMDANGKYVPTQVYLWATHEGPAVLLLDEIDGSMPNALLALNQMLANGIAVFPCGQVKIGRDKIVCATANTWGDGAGMEYTGRMAQDAAVVDRFAQRIHWGLDNSLERAIAKGYGATDEVVDACQRMRSALKSCGLDSVKWTPRRTYAVAQCVVAGDKLKDAFLAVGLAQLDENQRTRAFTAAGVK